MLTYPQCGHKKRHSIMNYDSFSSATKFVAQNFPDFSILGREYVDWDDRYAGDYNDKFLFGDLDFWRNIEKQFTQPSL